MANISAVETIHALAHAVKKQRAIQLEVEALGLVPMQVRVLKIIHRHSPCTALDIAHFMQRDKAQITRLMGGLMKHKLIEKVPNPQDKRSQWLLLTPEGDSVQASLSTLSRRTEQAMINTIAEKDMQTFFSVARKMLNNLKENP